MATPSEIILNVKKNVDGAVAKYAQSKEFEAVAQNALIDFIKRVKRGLMPDLSAIEKFSDKYKDYRKKNSSDLGSGGKIAKSNATATGQMLDAMNYQMKARGFLLFVKTSSRSKELGNRKSSLTNYDVAGYYRLVRDIFDFSKPELDRITRKVRTDLLKIIRQSK